MRLIEIKANEFGGHSNQTIYSTGSSKFPVPDGWAILPDDMVCENFPFGEITVDESTPPVVTSWTPGVVPEPEVVEEEPTTDELMNVLLGVTE